MNSPTVWYRNRSSENRLMTCGGFNPKPTNRQRLWTTCRSQIYTTDLKFRWSSCLIEETFVWSPRNTLLGYSFEPRTFPSVSHAQSWPVFSFCIMTVWGKSSSLLLLNENIGSKNILFFSDASSDDVKVILNNGDEVEGLLYAVSDGFAAFDTEVIKLSRRWEVVKVLNNCWNMMFSDWRSQANWCEVRHFKIREVYIDKQKCGWIYVLECTISGADLARRTQEGFQWGG